MRTGTLRRLAAIVAASALLISACGGDDDTSETSADAAPDDSADDTSEADPTAESADPSASVDADAEGSTDAGSSTDRSGETIRVGFVNEDAGPLSFPEFRIGGEVAFEHINATGGVHGAEIELVSCSTDLTPESSIDCANQLIEADVVAAFMAIDLASDAALPLYQEAGIPYVTSNNWGDAQAREDGSHLLHVATEGLTVGAFRLAAEEGLTKVAYLYEDSPNQAFIVETVNPPLAEAFGLELVSVGVDPASPDWTAAVATAVGDGAESIYGLVSEAGCTAMVKAALDAGFDGPIVAGACNAFLEDLGDASIGVYNTLDQLQPTTIDSAPAEIADNLRTYIDLMSEAGHEQYTEGYAIWTYGAALEFRSVLETIDGEITSEAIEAAFDADVAVPGAMGPDVTCAAEPWPSSPAHCSATVAVYQVEAGPDSELVRTEVIPFFDAYTASIGS